MLHRTPSGAKKRIRQRQEQRLMKSIPSNGTDHSSFNSPTSSSSSVDDGSYRSLVNDGGYKSILPIQPPLNTTLQPISNFIYSSMSTANYSSQINFIPTATMTMSPMSSFVMPTPSPSFMGGKPTVEVHPMPSQQQNLANKAPLYCSSCDVSNEKSREKPAVPKKPQKFKLVPPPSQHEWLPEQPLKNSSSTSDVKSSSLGLSSSPSPDSTDTCCRGLFSTPSLMCLHEALMEQCHTGEELKKLEAKRQKLIESISRKTSVLEEEKQSLNREIEQNNVYRQSVIDDLYLCEQEETTVGKLEGNLAQHARLIKLKTRLLAQLERCEGFFTSPLHESDKDMYMKRIGKLKHQIDDIVFLLQTFDRRDVALDNRICSMLSEHRCMQWRFYKQTWRRLITDLCEIDERLSLGKEQVNALLKAQPNL